MKTLLPLLAAGALLAAAPAAQAEVGLSGGSTQLTLDKGTAKALGSLGVKVAPTGPARAKGRKVTFPISGGSIDPATAAGTIAHRGGLRLSAGGTRVTLKNYEVSVGRKITLSAKLGRSRVTILDLTGKPKVTRSGFGTNVAGLTAKLNRAAAKALNGAFGVTAFKQGHRARQGQGDGDAVRDRAPRHGLDGAGDRPRRAAGDRRAGHHARRGRARDARGHARRASRSRAGSPGSTSARPR